MGARYEFWLTDDGGKRFKLLKNFFFADYSRTVSGFGTFNIGISYRDFKKEFSTIFQPDWRCEVWRAASKDVPLRMERSYLLREPRIYTRDSDNMDVLQIYGRDGTDLLNRRVIPQPVGTPYTKKSGAIDDIMKGIVRDQMLYGSCVSDTGMADNSRGYPTGEFSVDANTGLGPTFSVSCQDKNVLDVLKELYQASIQLNMTSSSNRKIYFDVVETQISGSSAFGFTFRTFADRRGADRTQGIEFSVENENLSTPDYQKSYFEEVNAVYTKGKSGMIDVVDTTRSGASRWNRSEKISQAGQQGDANAQNYAAYQELGAGIPRETLNLKFLNVPGSKNTPRSLYGIDWDLGDILPVSYAGMQFNCEVQIVYVAINDSGQETISGRNKVQ